MSEIKNSNLPLRNNVYAKEKIAIALKRMTTTINQQTIT